MNLIVFFVLLYTEPSLMGTVFRAKLSDPTAPQALNQLTSDHKKSKEVSGKENVSKIYSNRKSAVKNPIPTKEK